MVWLACLSADRDRPGVAVDGPALGHGSPQGLVVVLSVDVDEPRAYLGQLGEGGHAPVDPRT